MPNEELICPVCGSISRARRLLMLLNDEFIKSGDSVLDFSPSRVLYRIFNRRKDIHYFPSDFEDEFLSAYQYDITAIDAPDNKFDVIICYHILEHIEKDEKAINELYRVLKKQGKILVQTPFKEGDIFENPNINTATQRLQHFGQEDHVRIYSVKGLVRRLEKGGFITEVRTFSVDNYFGFAENETVIVCRKIG
ncbi:class I SAM-dependent methyltransferase [Marnyiella aurantia]|uniref:class I SAM-dependent methyltransferase n=1 Tax=Marnyiella aurantia TaxID=2758037 RepID=UPI001FD738A4|nr:methyltransferase domain-containing protein [Marnyiella aurantia]